MSVCMYVYTYTYTVNMQSSQKICKAQGNQYILVTPHLPYLKIQKKKKRKEKTPSYREITVF